MSTLVNSVDSDVNIVKNNVNKGKTDVDRVKTNANKDKTDIKSGVKSVKSGVNSGVKSGVNSGVKSVKSGVNSGINSVKSGVNSGINSVKSGFKSYFDHYSKFIHDLFFDLLQVLFTLGLFDAIINLTKYEANDLYPTNLHSKFYGDDESCDLGKMYAGETRFCNEKYTSIDAISEAGKSMFGSKLQTYAKNMGHLTSDSFSILLFWLSYTAFKCEHFSQNVLNAIHGITKKIVGFGMIINFIFFVIIASFIKYLNDQCIRPFLSKFLNFSKNANILSELATDLIINVACIITLLFLFIVIPLSIYYIFSIFILLIENLSIQINILCIFALYLNVSTLQKLINFIQSQIKGINQDSISNFINFLSSYILFFIIPIVVSLIQLYKIFSLLLSNIQFGVDTKYPLIFFSIILITFYYTIKIDLDTIHNFPISTIYGVLSILFIIYKYYKDQPQTTTTDNKVNSILK